MRILLYGFTFSFLLLLSACSTVPKMASYSINHTYSSPNQDSRIRTLVMHYTAASLDKTIEIFMNPNKLVSAQYVVPDKPDAAGKFQVYAMVPESRRAWHAGISYWQGSRLLNPSSIGIEIVNLGFPPEDEKLPYLQKHWYPYPTDQIKVVAHLMQKIITENQITPTQVVGHSDIAPGRKSDPGPLFPWESLYRKYGIGAWPEYDAVIYYSKYAPYDGDILKLQKKLAQYGYEIGQTGILDNQTQAVIAAFQMHFRVTRGDGTTSAYDGQPDIETVARLDALLEKYFKIARPEPTLESK